MSAPVFVSAEKISQITEDPTFSRYLQTVKTSASAKADRAVEPHQASPHSLCFVSSAESLQDALKGSASIIIALNKLKLTGDSVPEHVALYSTPSIAAAMALVLPFFDQKKSRFPVGIHPTAVIDPTAKVGQNVQIGAYVVIGADAKIGDNCLIGSHVVIERGAQIGAGTMIHSHVFIGADCIIGRNCEFHPAVTIGADGFGFVQGHDGRRHKVPQLGIVVIEDFVELGANCAVDRATLGETRIGEGTKFDNLCHVAHNCKIGKHNVFAGGFMIAGSSEIGDGCMIGGQTAVTDHVKIGNNIIIGGRAGVTKDVLEPGAYTGFPLQPMKDAVKTLKNMTHLTQMRKQLNEVRKHLGLKDEET